jgi:hydroxyacylglutathione hydrolase
VTKDEAAEVLEASGGGMAAYAGRHPDIAVTRLVVTPLAANCYLLLCRASGDLIVVDAGDEAGRILWHVDRLTGGRRERLRLLVNTHGHADHTAAVADLRAELGPVPVLMHPDDVELVEGNASDARRYLARDYTPVPPDRLLREGDLVAFGECALRVIETPGHSPGGICLYGHGLVLTGDSLFRRGVGSWKYFKGDRDALFGSLRAKVLTLPGETVVYPGHGEPTTIAEERAENRYVGATSNEQ